jgi:hypothetical protein
MSVPRPMPPTLLVIGVLSAPDFAWPPLLAALREAFGPEAFVRGPLAFDQTTYYEAEMGAPLQRRFAAMAAPFDAGRLAAAKLATNAIEARFAAAGKRRVNLDPGALSLFNFVLATGKGFTHRPYLGDGIYADLTLIWQNGGWQDLPWTYPDYRSAPVKTILTECRNYCRNQSREAWAIAPDRARAAHGEDA